MSDDIVEPVGWIYPDGTYTPHRGENLEQWGWSPVYAAATIERLTRERDRYASDAGERAAKLDAAEAEIALLKADLASTMAGLDAEGKAYWKAHERAEAAEAALTKAREALEALEDAYRAVEIAMPPEQGKAAVLAWMKARAALAPAKPCPICHGSGYDERTRITLHMQRCPNGCHAAPEGK